MSEVSKNLGHATAYGYAKSKGYTGTEAEFAELMASYATTAEVAVYAAERAKASEDAAKASETASAASETAAATSAGTATTAAQTASQAAQIATTKASEATTAATTATTKAAEASQSATEAAGSATTAGTAATNAQAAQTAAEAAQTAAETAQGAAEDAAESVAGKTEQIDENTEDISLLKSHLNATEIVDTASGAIATFADGSDGVPVESLTVSMEPIQDLHGQDAPYPAGGGKNLLNPALFVEQAGWYIIELTLTPNTAYTMSSNMPLAKADELPVYFKTDNIGGGNAAILVYTGHPVTQTSDENGHLYISERRVSGTDVFSNYQWQIELGSTATTFAPYSNICPISGRTAVTVTRAGKNLFDKNISFTDDKIISADGSIVDNSAYQYSDYIAVNGDTQYVFSGKIVRISAYNSVAFYTGNKEFISRFTPSAPNIPAQFTTPASCRYIRFNATDPLDASFDANTIQLERGSVATAYEPYNGQAVTIQLGETVYGGSLDVTTGEMVVETVFAQLDANTTYLTMGYSYSAARRTWSATITNIPGMADTLKPNGRYWSSVGASGKYYYQMDVTGFTMSSKYPIFVIANDDSGLESTSSGTEIAAAINAWIHANTPQIVYELAQPLTVQLSPSQLSTVLGLNNVWSNADSVSVDYVADTKLFIEQLTEPDADMVADANITSGQYFMVGNQLYLATANIASGGTISPGVNCTRTNLAAALNAINS